MTEVRIDDIEVIIKLFGNLDKNIELISGELGVAIALRSDVLEVSGGSPEEEKLAAEVLEKLVELGKKGDELTSGRIRYLIELAREGELDKAEEIFGSVIAITSRGKPVKSRTLGQKKYVQAIKHSSVVIAIGPAGTGKTYLAVALAVQAYKNKDVERIILTRPAVEAGEKLGFLPGDLQEKVNPYLRPLYDALAEMLGQEQYLKLIERGVIEVAPLAYMRGRTLSSAFIILDEAQNTTPEQMKMVLTRIGEGSKMVINGDITQVDLPEGKQSGLTHAARVLEGVKEIAVLRLTNRDVVRRELVQSIIRAYEKSEGQATPRGKKLYARTGAKLSKNRG